MRLLLLHLRIRDPGMFQRTSHIHNNPPNIHPLPLNMVLRTPLQPSIVMSRTRTGSRVILNNPRNRKLPLQATTRHRTIPNETYNRKLLLQATRHRIILDEPGNSKLPLRAISNLNIQLNTSNSHLPKAQTCLIMSLHPMKRMQLVKSD